MEDGLDNTGNQSYQRSIQNSTEEGVGSRSTRNVVLRAVNHHQRSDTGQYRHPEETLGN